MEHENYLTLVTIVAIFLGPVFSVLVTRFIDKQRENKARRLKVFQDLMQTRGLRLDPLHVAALNVVELEFYHAEKVREAFRNYISHLGAPMPEQQSEQNRFFEQRSDLFIVLLSEIGKILNYHFDKRDLERNSYVPQGWDTDQSLQRRNAQLLNAILSGQRPLPIGNFLAKDSPYPEPPSD
jgi:hypothetical protein